MSTSIAFFLLLSLAFTGSLAKQHVVYVDANCGSLQQSCWTGGEYQPCKTLEFALRGVETNVTIIKIGEKLSGCSIRNTTEHSCPTWTRYSASSKSCECGASIGGAVDCHKVDFEHEVSLLRSYLMTYDVASSKELVGKTIMGFSYNNRTVKLFKSLPTHRSELNNVCKLFNRAGKLCGDCEEGYALSAYSYDLVCSNCTYSPSNWFKYLAAAYIPLTVFFVLVLVFRISATAPQLHGFVNFSQAVASGVIIRPILLSFHNRQVPSVICRFVFSLYGIWNLDFLRTALPSICLNVSPLLLLALDYAIAFYPLVLIIVSYLLIELYARDFKPVVFMWKPFHKLCFSRLQKPLNLSSSMVNAFATFFLLSYVKILNTSFDLLIPTKIYDINGTSIGFFLFYATSVDYFGQEHLPYGIIASFIFALFVLLPLLVMLLYPMRWFQKLLNFFHLRTHVLHIFMDSFQGYYKDGTEPGTWDCRYFAATYLIVRLVLFIIYSFTLNLYFFFMGLFLLVSVAILWIIAHPYKHEFSAYNSVDTAMCLLLALYFLGMLAVQFAGNEHFAFVIVSFILVTAVLLVPLIYVSVITIVYFVKKSFMGLLITSKLKRLLKAPEHRSFEDSLPYRLTNSIQYERGAQEAIAEYEDWTESSA